MVHRLGIGGEPLSYSSGGLGSSRNTGWVLEEGPLVTPGRIRLFKEHRLGIGGEPLSYSSVGLGVSRNTGWVLEEAP